MPDPLALAAACIARGVKPPVYVETLSALYAAQGAGERVTLSPQLAKFFAEIEEKRKETPR